VIFSIVLAACNGGGDGGSSSSGGSGSTTSSGVVIQGSEGTAISVPSDPTQIAPMTATIDTSGTVSYNSADGSVTVHFFYKDASGNGISLTKNAIDLRFLASQLVTDPTAKVDPGPTWHQLFAETGTPGDPSASQLPGTLTVINGDTGEYSYKFAGSFPATGDVIRVTVRARYRVTVGDTRYYVVFAANSSYDFHESDPGTALASSGADMADTNACTSCHGPLGRPYLTANLSIGHGSYTEIKTCDHCHNLPYQTPRNGGEGDLAYMVHHIHDAKKFDQLHGGADYTNVTYPQEISNCSKCHDSAAPNANVAFANPTRRNCGSCHTTVDFATGANHAGGSFADDSLCGACHTPTGSSINGGIPGTDHKSMIAGSGLAPKKQDLSEFSVTIQMTPPANGSYYVAGEAPMINVLLTPIDGGPAVNYAAAGPKGSRDGILSELNLFVYGPRSFAVPVLTTGSTTDPAYDPSTAPTQGHSLLIGASDPLVQTDANGFHYQLMAIPGNLAAGTYMVRVEAADYGGVSNSDFVTSSSGLINFQVGQAEEQPKVSGSACTNCHGDTIMHLEGAHAHHVPFNTDYCLACHDRTTNHGDYIGNRVHAVHSASLTGDLSNRDWTHVTFPQDINNCTICHTNTNAAVPVWQTTDPAACAGCHGSDPNSPIQHEAIGASHMLLMGADFSSPKAEAGCLVCHGKGQSEDLYIKHNLVQYSVPNNTPDQQL
jgi:hypothetical protein